MFLGYQNDKPIFIANTREELENKPRVKLDKIKEVDFAEMYNGVIYISKENLIKAKCDEIRTVRDSYLEKYVDPKQLVMVWDSLSVDERNTYSEYRKYLLDYTDTEDWYLHNPMTFDEWISAKTDEYNVSRLEYTI